MFQISVAQQNSRLSAMLTEAGASPVIKIYTGSLPANVAAARTGTVLATLNLPTTYFSAPSGGSMSLTGTWSDNAADAAGTCGYFTLFKTDGSTACWQGDVTITGGGGALTVDNPVFAVGQAFTITAFTVTDANG